MPFYMCVVMLAVFGLTVQAFAQSLKDIYTSGKARFVAEITIEESKLPEGELFENIVDIAVDEEGNIYLCDIQANNIKKFSPEGKFVKIIGRKGQGPGEFITPSHIVVSGKRLFVYEIGNRRLCSLTTGGEYINNIPIQFSEGLPLHIRALPGGDIVIEKEVNYYREKDKPQDCFIQIFSPELELKKNLFTHPVMKNKFREIKGIFANIVQPFAPEVYWSVGPDGRIVIGLSEDYTIGFYGAEEGLFTSFKHAFKPVKVTDEDKEKFFSRMSYTTSEGETGKLPDEIKKLTEFPKTKPAFMGLFLDYEGNILVNVIRSEKAGAAPECEAFDPDGNFLGVVEMDGLKDFPRRFVLEKDSLWILVWEEDGSVRAVKYRIAPGK